MFDVIEGKHHLATMHTDPRFDQRIAEIVSLREHAEIVSLREHVERQLAANAPTMKRLAKPAEGLDATNEATC